MKNFLHGTFYLCLMACLTFSSCSDDPVLLSEICNNNIDDDGNGLIDCDDPACNNADDCVVLVQSEICGNNLDDDGDGLVDCNDPDCNSAPDCLTVVNEEWTDHTYFSNRIEELKVFDNKLFITGNFTKRENSNCYFSSYFSNNSFTNHTTLIMGGGVSELTIFDNELYGAGSMATFGGIGLVKWDGSSWLVSGPSYNEDHNCIYTDGTTLYIGSGFGKVSYKTIGSGYEQFPVLPGERYTTSITEFNGDLIVGGDFDNSVVRWTGSAWEALGGGTTGSGTVRKLLNYDGKLIAAGSFSDIGGQDINDIAIWDGTNWASIGSGGTSVSFNGVRDMLVHNGELYVVGDFTEIGGVSAKYIAKWNGNNWQDLNFNEGDNFDDFPMCVEVFNNKIFIGTASSDAAHLYSLEL